VGWGSKEGLGSVSPVTAILVSTFDRYEALARWTEDRIHKEWPEHPPVFFSGLSWCTPESLGFEGDSKDWMSVTIQATQALRARGFSHAYLLLDDHPPVGKCNAPFLNEKLPRLALQINAAHISLLGYGQHRKQEGLVEVFDGIRLERLPSSYRWKFSLHPGLWNLADLQFLLEQRMAQYAGRERTPWNFERHRDLPEDRATSHCGARCHRINGVESLVEARPMHLLREAWLRFEADVAMFLAKLTAGMPARTSMEQKTLWRFGHYAGPYPLYWSGCLRQGKIHADFEKWLSRSANKNLKSSFEHFQKIYNDCICKKKT
jgi:hypothetical protein